VLRKIYGTERDEVIGDWRKLHNEEVIGEWRKVIMRRR
jgi:hypothetical protein